MGEVPIGCVFVHEDSVNAASQAELEKAMGNSWVEFPIKATSFVSAVHSWGRNATNETYNATLHAEIVALQGLYEKYQEEICDSGSTVQKNAQVTQALEKAFNLKKYTLYVTVEPCIMCMAALLDLEVHRIVFGCYNDRFGGCGGTQTNLLKVKQHAGPLVEPGLGAKEAITYLRRFYLKQNERAPIPKKKSRRVLKLDDLQ